MIYHHTGLAMICTYLSIAVMIASQTNLSLFSFMDTKRQESTYNRETFLKKNKKSGGQAGGEGN